MTQIAAGPRRAQVLGRQMAEAVENVGKQQVKLNQAIQKRDELMAELHDAGFTLTEIGSIVGYSHVGVLGSIRRAKTGSTKTEQQKERRRERANANA